MPPKEDHYPSRLQGIRRHGGSVPVYANIPLPLARALDLETGSMSRPSRRKQAGPDQEPRS